MATINSYCVFYPPDSYPGISDEVPYYLSDPKLGPEYAKTYLDLSKYSGNILSTSHRKHGTLGLVMRKRKTPQFKLKVHLQVFTPHGTSYISTASVGVGM